MTTHRLALILVCALVTTACDHSRQEANPGAADPAASTPAESPRPAEPPGPPAPPAEAAEAPALDTITIPGVALIDQDGRDVDVLRDRIGNRVAAIQVMFTRCTTACPLLGRQFHEVQEILGDRLGNDFALISVTVDPAHDGPAVLKAWAERYEARPGWSQITGPKPDVDRFLRGIGAATTLAQNHTSQVLVYDGATGKGVRTNGLGEPAALASLMRRVREARPKTPVAESETDDSANEAGRRYFTNTLLLDQNAQPRRFYDDLLRGKTVVINVFFTSCKGSCLVMEGTLARLQDRLSDRLERDIRLISITVDCGKDTPEVLAQYARNYGARPGWYFLTGDKPSVDGVLRKLGQYVETPDAHGAIMLVGNLRTGLWKKVFGLAPSDEVIAQVFSVLESDGQ